MDNESYQAGWQWAQDRLSDYSLKELRTYAEGASADSDDPDAFFEGALDALDKEADRRR